MPSIGRDFHRGFVITPETITWAWLIAGGVLAVSEIFVPGGVVIFLGTGAMAVAGLRAVGILESLPTSLAAWFALSLASIIGLRGLVQRFSSSEKLFQPTDEDIDAFGSLVEVASEVDEASDGGRVRFRGTTWAARSVRGVLPPGTPCRIVHRDNLVWVVEPVGGAAPLTAPAKTGPASKT